MILRATLFLLTALALSGAGASAPAAGPQAAPVRYELRNLRPLGLTHLSGSPARQLLQFQNEQGAQNLLYEEAAGTAPLREIAGLTPFFGSSANLCSVDLDCRAKAFCTEGCASFYYELSNRAGASDSCRIRAFSCQASRAPASAPAAPAATRPGPPPARQTVIIGPKPAARAP